MRTLEEITAGLPELSNPIPGGVAGSATQTVANSVQSEYERAQKYVDAVPGAQNGTRNNELNALAYRILERFNVGADELEQLGLEWNARSSPPLPEHEARTTIRSAWSGCQRKGAAGRKRTEQSSRRGAPANRANGAIPDDEWPEPLPLTKLADAPAFPQGIFPTWLEAFVKETARALEVPYDLCALLALGVLAAVLQKKFKLRVNTGWIEELALFCILGLESGSGKSPCFRAFMTPVTDFESTKAVEMDGEILLAQREQEILLKRIHSLQNDLVKNKKGAKQSDLDEAYRALDALIIPKPPLIFAGDATPESIGQLLAANFGRMTVASPEGEFLEILNGRYSDSPAIEVALKGYTGDCLKIHRASKDKPPIIVQTPAFSLVLCVQPDVLQKLATNATLAGRGFLARCFFSVPESRLGFRSHTEPPVAEAITAEYERRITALLSTSESLPVTDREIESVEVRVDRAVNDAVVAFRQKVEPNLRPGAEMRDCTGFLSGWAGKAGGLALRVSGLLALADERQQVSLADFQRGQAVADYGKEHAKALAKLIGADPNLENAKRILGWIERKHCPHFQRRDICKDLNIKSADQTGPLELLTEHEFIRPIEVERAPQGRKSNGPTNFQVNPHVIFKG